MIFLLLLFSYILCSDSSSSDNGEHLVTKKIKHKLESREYISKEDYTTRVYSVLPKTKKGNLIVSHSDPKEAMSIFTAMLEKIHNHFKGHRVKLAAFTSVLLNKYDNKLDFILCCDHFEDCRNKRGALQLSRLKRMRILHINHVDMSLFTFSDRKRAIDTLRNEFKFFIRAIKYDYTFENIVETFFPHYFKEENLSKGKYLEYVYYIIVYGEKSGINNENEEFIFLFSDSDN